VDGWGVRVDEERKEDGTRVEILREISPVNRVDGSFNKSRVR
jgi:hypothetical protein